jgi:UPF0176 protein
MNPQVANIAAYKFAPLTGLKELRVQLLASCRELELKGTILLAPEGINLFLAGSLHGVQAILAQLRAIPGLEDLHPKVSFSEEQPHTRLLVRLKREIIAFGVYGVEPARYTSRRLAPRQLKEWLDAGKPLMLLDTRNTYEVKLGTFRGAVDLGLEQFRDFPQVAQRKLAPPGVPVVTFCTGGIRCEKAAPWLENSGIPDVWQLDGGILRYFEEVGGDHFDGECFVFDRRVGVDPALSETGSALCFACQAPLTTAEQEDDRYRPGQSCPHCFVAPEARLHEALMRVSAVLPGSVPGENRRPLRIPGRLDGATLAAVLRELFPHIEPGDWEEVSARGHLRSSADLPVSLNTAVRAGEQYWRVFAHEVEPEVNATIRVVYQDPALLVLNKPAPLPIHACGRFHRNTLTHLLELACHPEKPRPAHRLDANTTGILVCARTHHFARWLQPQFAAGTVEKTYLALVHGHPAEDEFLLDWPVPKERTTAGVRSPKAAEVVPARTRVRVRQRCDDNQAVLEAEPITGRTNQIRFHLWRAGHPVVGDPAYLPGGETGTRQTLEVGEPPMHLHSWKVTLRHPQGGQLVKFEVAPDWEWV